jgi:hypothetical protein
MYYQTRHPFQAPPTEAFHSPFLDFLLHGCVCMEIVSVLAYCVLTLIVVDVIDVSVIVCLQEEDGRSHMD